MTEQTISERIEAAIRSVTDLWDEPLDEVHDVPQIVNALLAAGIMQEVRAEALREAADAFEPEVVRAAKWASETSDSFREAMSRKWAWGEAIKRLRDRADSIVRARRDGCGDRG